MSLLLPVVCAVGAAVAYGGATAVQHSAVQSSAANPSAGQPAVGPDTVRTAESGRADAGRLLALLTNPRWLFSVAGDAVGLLLQVIALATGPVVVVQPLLVLAVAVALPVGWALGGPRPGATQALAGVAVIAALGVFFVLVGDPGVGRRMPAATAVATGLVALLAGAGLCLLVLGRPARVRAVVFGAVAGSGFGVVGVLLNSVAAIVEHDGFVGLVRSPGLLPSITLIVVGAAAMVLTQVSFQIGELSASFPANEAAAPVIAVVLGGALLHERVPLSAGLIAAYVGCLGVVVAGTIRLARG